MFFDKSPPSTCRRTQTAPTVEAITPLLESRNTAKRKEQIAAILESLAWG